MAKRLLAELTPGKAKKAAHGVTALVGCRYMVGRRHDDRAGLKDALRLLPDVVRLLRRLSTDPNLPKGVRVRLVLLLAAGSGQAAGRLVRTEVDYSRLYMAGHVPSDLVDGTLLGDTLAEYYLVRFPGSPGQWEPHAHHMPTAPSVASRSKSR